MTAAIGVLVVKFTHIKLFKSFWTNYSLSKSAITTEVSNFTAYVMENLQRGREGDYPLCYLGY